MASMFGGATVISAKGAWVNDKQEVIYDDIDIVYSYCNPLDAVELDEVNGLALWVKRELKQDCVSLVIDEVLTLV
jgi:hypothetical protein